MTSLTEDLAAEKLQRMNNDELLAHLIERLPAIRAALDGGDVSQDELALKTIITAAERAYDTLYQHGDFHLANELSQAIVIARREVPFFASLDNSLPPETATDKLISDFAVALKSKLNTAREKYGYHNEAWQDDGWLSELLKQLEKHLTKGDPRDVAAYCAFAWYHDWNLAALRAPQQQSSERDFDALLRQIPDGYALDHLCQHYTVTTGKAEPSDGKWTCKLATGGRPSVNPIRKITMIGDTASDALQKAITFLASRQEKQDEAE